MPTVSKAVKALTTRTAEERLKRLQHQNTKLKLEIAAAAKQLVPLGQLQGEVLRANAMVKQQVLAVPYRTADVLATMTSPREIMEYLTGELARCLGDLAYERESFQTPAVVLGLVGDQAQAEPE